MISVALLQLFPGHTQGETLQKGLDACRLAKTMGADIALFPEMWSTGYVFPADLQVLQAAAISRDGPFIGAFIRLAKELELAVGITYLEQYDPAPRNTLTVIDRTGRCVLTYAKVHTCDFDTEKHLTPGDDFPTAGFGNEKRAGYHRRNDLLRPGVPGKRAHPDAQRRGNHIGSQRLPDGNQPPVAAARARLRKHAGDRHGQLPIWASGLQRPFHRV